MFDELRGCWITIHWPHSHQFRTPLGSTRGFQGLKYISSSALRFFAPGHANGLRDKNKTEFFLRRTNPWTNRGTTSKSHGKTQKSRGKTQKSRGRGDQISQTGICCVFSIDTKNSWIKCTGLLVGSMWDRARNLGNISIYVHVSFLQQYWSPRGPRADTGEEKMLSHIAAPSASLQSNGTENRPFGGICQRYLLMSFVTKTGLRWKTLQSKVFWL